MEEDYKEVYGILSGVDTFTKDQHNQLISIYGKKVVDEVMGDLLEENEEYFFKFDSCFSFTSTLENCNNLNSMKIYMSNVKKIACLDADKNLMLVRKINEIVNELEEIFIFLNCDDSIVDGCFVPWIADKVEYCLKVCNDVDLLNRINNLYNKFCYYRDIVVSGNLRWVVMIATKYVDYSDDLFGDVVQIGNIGLIRAVEKFDIIKGTSFSTYAKYWIEQNIIRSLKKMKYSVNVSESLIYSSYHLLNTKNALCLQLGREISNKELSVYTGISVKDIELMEGILVSPLSLDEPVDIGYNNRCGLGFRYCDIIAEDKPTVFEQVASDVSLVNIERILQPYLNDREIKVVKLYFGFEGKYYTLKEIADVLNVSIQMISRVKATAIKKLSKQPEIKTLL